MASAHSKKKEIFVDDRSPNKTKIQQYNQTATRATRASPHFHPQAFIYCPYWVPCKKKAELNSLGARMLLLTVNTNKSLFRHRKVAKVAE